MKTSKTLITRMSGTLVAVACSALVLTGCGTGSSSGVPAKNFDEVADAPVESGAGAAPAGNDELSEDGGESDVKAFGETWTYDDGLAVTIKYLGSGRVTSSGIGAEDSGGALQKFSITVKNGSDRTFDGRLASIDSVSVGDEGTEAQEVFDTAGGLEGADFSKIQAGRKQTRTVAYGIKGAETVQIEFSAGSSYASVLYEGKLKK